MKKKMIGILAALAIAAVATSSPRAEAQQQSQERAHVIQNARNAMNASITWNSKARANWRAALEARFKGGSFAQLELERRISYEWAGRAIQEANFAMSLAQSVGDWELAGRIEGVVVGAYVTSKEIGLVIKTTNFRYESAGTASYVADQGERVTFYSGYNFLTIGWPDGTFITSYADGATTIKASSTGSTVNITPMGTCIHGCQLLGANVILFAKDSSGTLGDYVALPFNPLDLFTQEMMRQDVMMNQALP